MHCITNDMIKNKLYKIGISINVESRKKNIQ